MASTAYNPERDQRVQELTLQGWTAKAIAEELGLHPDSVSRIRTRVGANKGGRPSRISDSDLRLIEALLEDGCPIPEIARTVGHNPQYLQVKFVGRSKVRGDELRSHRRLIKELGL